MMEKFGKFNPQAFIFPESELKVQEIQAQIDTAIQQMMVLQQVDPVRQIYQVWTLPAHELVALDVRIQTGNLSMSKQSLINTTMVLFEMGFLPAQSVLKVLDYPGWRDAVRIMSEQQEAMAQSEEEALDKQFDMERLMKEVEHSNEMELEQLEGSIKLAVPKMQLKAAKERQAPPSA